MANYQKIIPYTLDFEGGLTEDKNDSGGITNYGVCLMFAKDTRDLELFDKDKDGDIDRNDIKKLTPEDAKKAFKKYFWDKMQLDTIESDKKAFVIFDTAMNSGLGNAIPMTQKALVDLGEKITIDGKYGPKTRAALDSVDEDEFCETFLNIREKFYHKIVAKRPSQKVFLRGWLNRINGIRKILISDF